MTANYHISSQFFHIYNIWSNLQLLNQSLHLQNECLSLVYGDSHYHHDLGHLAS